MPISRRIAHFNNRVTNRLSRHIAGWMPGFAIVVHTGRHSGRSYRTPVNVFRTGTDYVFALTYGADSDWVQNVLARGECEIETGGKKIELRNPRRFTDRTRHLVPIPARWILRILRVDDFLSLTPLSGHDV